MIYESIVFLYSVSANRHGSWANIDIFWFKKSGGNAKSISVETLGM